MKGLIYKELFILKGLWKSWGFGFLFIAIYGFLFKNAAMVYMLPPIFGINGMLVSFTYDRTYQWETAVLGMPVSRRQIIGAKFLFLAMLDLVMMLVATGILLICNLLGFRGLSLEEELLTGGAIFLVLLFYQAVQMPVICKIGVEKARLVCVVLALTPLLCLAVPWEKLPGEITAEMILGAELAMIPLVLAALAVSVWLSGRFYEQKEF